MLQSDGGLKLVFLLLSSWQSASSPVTSSLNRKARRKDRDGDQTVPDTKPYLDENVLERKLPDADLRTIVDLPPGLDYNEWLASHSEYLARGLFVGRGGCSSVFEEETDYNVTPKDVATDEQGM